MIQIRPVSDLRNKYPKIEKIVNNGEPVFLTKNGYGSMVVHSLEDYSNLTDNIEKALLQAETAAESDPTRYSREHVYSKLKDRINEFR